MAGVALLTQLLHVLKFVLKQLHLKDPARCVDQVEDEEVQQLSVLVLYIGDDDFLYGFGARLQVHFEEVMRVELVVDEEGVAFGYCVDQWRFLWDFEGCDPDSADIQSLPDLVVVQADNAKGSADVEAE